MIGLGNPHRTFDAEPRRRARAIAAAYGGVALGKVLPFFGNVLPILRIYVEFGVDRNGEIRARPFAFCVTVPRCLVAALKGSG
jgi:hypothetical protein